MLLIFIAQPDRLAGHVLGPGGPALSGAIMGEALAALAPIFLVPIGAVLVSLFAQQAITFSGDKIAPKLDADLAARQRQAQVRRRRAGRVRQGAGQARRHRGGALRLSLARPRPDDRRRHRRGRVLGAMLMESLVVLLTITCVIAVTIGAIDLVWQRFDHARRLRMSYQDMREEIEAVRRRPAHEGAAPQPRRGDRHQPDAARRAEGGRGHRQPHPLRGGAEMVPGARAPPRSASPRARARWRCASARWRRPPASPSTAIRPPPGRSSPRSRSAARSRRSTTAPSPPPSASPTGCAAPRAPGARA